MSAGALEALDRILNRGGEADDVLREVVGVLAREPGIAWAGILFREEGRLVLGPEAEIASGPPYELTPLQRRFLFTRADTIYAGSNQIQRNIIAERGLGLPREPRP